MRHSPVHGIRQANATNQHATTRQTRDTVSAPDADLVQPATTAPSTNQPHGQDTGLRTTTQLAMKALLASAIGLPLGFVLSPAHPYFVLVATYAVITVSFGSVLEAASSDRRPSSVHSVRLGCAGLLSGIPIESGITIVLIGACFFLGVYLSPLSPHGPASGSL